MLGQDGIFDRAEKSRLGTCQKNAELLQIGMAGEQGEGRERDDENFDELDAPRHAGLVEFVGELACKTREQEKRQDEQSS